MPPFKDKRPKHSGHLLKEPLFWFFICGLVAFGAAAATLLHISLLLPLFFVGGIISLLLLYRNPLVLLMLLVVVRMSLDYSTQYFSVTIEDLSLSFSQLLGVGIAVVGVLLLLFKRNELKDYPLKVPFLLVFVWGLATLTYSIEPRATLQELLRFFDLFVLGFLGYVAVKKTEDFKQLLTAFLVSALLPLFFGLYQFLFRIGLDDENVSVLRIFGTFSHPNVFSLYLFSLIIFAALYYLIFARTSKSRIVTLLLLAVLTGMLILTFARVAWVALFFFAFLVALFRYRLLLFPLFLFPFILFVFSPPFQERVAESFRTDPDSSILWRQTLWHDVATKSLQDGKLLLGSGMNTFPLVSQSLRGTTLGSNEPHNDFVKFFVEGGVVGAIVYGLYIISLLVILYRGYKKSRPQSALRLAYGFMLLFFLSLQLSSLTDNVFKNTPVQWLFFIALGSLLSLSRETKEK